MERVLLISDTPYPNLALMHQAAWYRRGGAAVGFNVSNPTIVLCSIVFKNNRHMADGLRFWYPDARIEVGGSGYDLHKALPPEVERLCPDYSIYPGLDYSMGRTSYGCIRHCYFCIVPEKEGHYQRWQHPREFVRHDKVRLLDNNWYADPEWFFETSDWLISNNVAVDVTQGMDIRLLTPEIAMQLKRLKWCATMHFAFDDEQYTQAVLDGIKVLKDAGIDTRSKCTFYVYCHDDAHYESAVARCRLLKEHKVSAYAMFNMDQKRTERIKHLQRWTARPWLFWGIDIDDYDGSIKGHLDTMPGGKVMP